LEAIDEIKRAEMEIATARSGRKRE